MSLNGTLENLALSDLFQMLSAGNKTGTLIVNGSSGTAVVVFKKGLIVRAETSELKETVGHDLMNDGIIQKTKFKIAMEIKKELPAKPIADILLDIGAVNRHALDMASAKRIKKVIYRLMLWQDGNFQFKVDDIAATNDKTEVKDPGWEVSNGISPEYLIMESARVFDESIQQGLVSIKELARFKMNHLAQNR